MKIEHIAIWVKDLERMKHFYETYFEAQANALYHNPLKGFSSYFLHFKSGPRLELMHRTDIDHDAPRDRFGYAHIAFSLGSRFAVDQLTARLERDGYTRLDGPRLTGDGYYESVFLDPEGLTIELTV